MTTYSFQRVNLPAEQAGKCPVCAKRVVRRQTFWQTINPWNKNAEGQPKTYDEIRVDLRAERDAWVPDFTHEKCRAEAPAGVTS
jgi:hypothetical protein